MKPYFPQTLTLDEAKKLRRQYVVQYHPDRGGDTETMAQINAAYDRFVENYGKPGAPVFQAPPTTDPTAWWSTVVNASKAPAGSPPRSHPQPRSQTPPPPPPAPPRPRRTANPGGSPLQDVWTSVDGHVVVKKQVGSPVLYFVFSNGHLLETFSGAPQAWKKLERAAIDYASCL